MRNQREGKEVGRMQPPACYSLLQDGFGGGAAGRRRLLEFLEDLVDMLVGGQAVEDMLREWSGVSLGTALRAPPPAGAPRQRTQERPLSWTSMRVARVCLTSLR